MMLEGVLVKDDKLCRLSTGKLPDLKTCEEARRYLSLVREHALDDGDRCSEVLAAQIDLLLDSLNALGALREEGMTVEEDELAAQALLTSCQSVAILMAAVELVRGMCLCSSLSDDQDRLP